MHVRPHHRYAEIHGGRPPGRRAPYLCTLAGPTDSCRDLGSPIPLKPLRGLVDFSFPPKDPLVREWRGLRPAGTDTANALLEAMRQVWGAPATRLSGKEA